MKSQRQKRIEAEQRAAAHAKRTPEQQLALIATRRGSSHRETDQLNALIQARKPVEVTKNTTVANATEAPKKVRKPRAKKS